MPGYDGTGPRGRGPMTGKGYGYCLMKIPEDPHWPRTGFVGLSGRPVTLPPTAVISDVMLSSAQIARIQKALDSIERSLRDLEVAIRRTGGSHRGGLFDGAKVRPDRGAS